MGRSSGPWLSLNHYPAKMLIQAGRKRQGEGGRERIVKRKRYANGKRWQSRQWDHYWRRSQPMDLPTQVIMRQGVYEEYTHFMHKESLMAILFLSLSLSFSSKIVIYTHNQWNWLWLLFPLLLFGNDLYSPRDSPPHLNSSSVLVEDWTPVFRILATHLPLDHCNSLAAVDWISRWKRDWQIDFFLDSLPPPPNFRILCEWKYTHSWLLEMSWWKFWWINKQEKEHLPRHPSMMSSCSFSFVFFSVICLRCLST